MQNVARHGNLNMYTKRPSKGGRKCRCQFSINFVILKNLEFTQIYIVPGKKHGRVLCA